MSEILQKLSAEEFSKFKADDKGEVQIPEGYQVVKVPTKAEELQAWQKEIDDFKAEKEPTDSELIDFAKQFHDYYFRKQRAEELEQRMKKVEPIIKK